MKSIKEIIAQDPVFLNDWSNKEEVLSDFDGEQWNYDSDKKVDRNINILFASYGQENYSGDAWVLFEKDGELYEVNGSHCSCYGLEGQFSPEVVVLAELENRLVNGTFGEDDWSDNNFKKELCQFLGVRFELNREEF
ncbi:MULTISPECIES: hypothetical protein [Bacillus]|uniref:hypothetical protein n=1 Tax=Bacillus TaxID=1386 RepID=UPI002452D77D|nr:MULTISPECIES: hypothetical protein [Bacillus]MDH3081515.1 hypothetical protein [Bacillus amyloliquefaciens]MDU0074898.1 hypothetical protein [Bacillus sp. IG2]MDU0100608.1 hypothetical protein [Bacillus sp. IS1]MEC2272730.1 hypothetical protein [Bacillus velezensis]MED3680905.1 hypothetical protein [Bacillus velezensis]